mgnify:CR=1 FL=1
MSTEAAQHAVAIDHAVIGFSTGRRSIVVRKAVITALNGPRG